MAHFLDYSQIFYWKFYECNHIIDYSVDLPLKIFATMAKLVVILKKNEATIVNKSRELSVGILAH